MYKTDINPLKQKPALSGYSDRVCLNTLFLRADLIPIYIYVPILFRNI